MPKGAFNLGQLTFVEIHHEVVHNIVTESAFQLSKKEFHFLAWYTRYMIGYAWNECNLHCFLERGWKQVIATLIALVSEAWRKIGQNTGYSNL